MCGLPAGDDRRSDRTFDKKSLMMSDFRLIVFVHRRIVL